MVLCCASVTALISITDFDDCAVELINKPDFLLRVTFDDVDNDVIVDELRIMLRKNEFQIVEEKYHMLSDNIADEVARFYFEFRDKIELLICQCEHGQSRSAAVAAAIPELRSRRGIDVFFNYNYYPNKAF